MDQNHQLDFNMITETEVSDEIPKQILEILLKEYDTLRTEIQERLKVAFSHVAYAGAVVAFAVPAADKVAAAYPANTNALIYILPVSLAALGFLMLIWVAVLNMRWVQHCGFQIRKIEDRVNKYFHLPVLGWENYGETVKASSFFLIPKPPQHICSKSETKQRHQ